MEHTIGAALARKLSMAQDDVGDRPHSILRALRLGFARVAAERFNLPLAVIGAKQSERKPENLANLVGEDVLMLLFSGEDGVSAACLDVNTVSAIVQSQTIGEVTQTPPPVRAFTDTDAAMTAPLVEDALKSAAALGATEDEHARLSAVEFTSRATDRRTLVLALVDDAYRVFDLTIDLAGGLRQGRIFVLLPDLSCSADDSDGDDTESGLRLEQSSGVLRAELNAVLCRVTLPFDHLSELRVGAMLPLAGARLDRTEVVSIDGLRASVGRLGQCGGMRAVRLNECSALPVITNPEEFAFIESQAASPAVLDHENANTMPLDPVRLSEEVDVTHTDLPFDDSNRIAAEISQLAGLTDSEDAADHLP
ncbi:MAG: FliM/FliN family flagellar motor C-terminal domain-containing protein [Pseudomonadota bacterium]